MCRLLLLGLAVSGSRADDGGPWHVDADGDGFLDDTDCDDTSAEVHPGASESCDEVDEDCDGTPDDHPTDGTVWTVDADGDEFGDDLTAVVSCAAIPGTVATGGDCDDDDASRNPGATEVCGGIDEDCDGLLDDLDPDTIGPIWYADADGDGHGDPAAPVRACVRPAGHVASHG